MFEVFKIMWDLFVLRDAQRKGQLGWKKVLFAIGFVLLEYIIALPAVLLYEKHPQYKSVFIAAMVLVVINFVAFVWLALGWRSSKSTTEPS